MLAAAFRHSGVFPQCTENHPAGTPVLVVDGRWTWLLADLSNALDLHRDRPAATGSRPLYRRRDSVSPLCSDDGGPGFATRHPPGRYRTPLGHSRFCAPVFVVALSLSVRRPSLPGPSTERSCLRPHLGQIGRASCRGRV